MTTMSTSTSAIAEMRDEQRRQWDSTARKLDRQARKVCETIALADDHEYHDPDDYDLRTWRGEALYTGISIRLGYAVRISAALAKGGGPFYCPEHEQHKEGWYGYMCLECAWQDHLGDDALSWARTRARAWRMSAGSA